MSSALQQEIQQTTPFATLKEEVWLNLTRTAAMLLHGMEQQLRSFGLSLTQYNVLRILRGAGAAGLCQWEIRARLVAQVPDVPRILDRMEKAGWVERVRGESDRRTVMTSLTGAGLRLVNELDAPLGAIMAGMFPKLDESQMSSLNDLLVAARSGSACERAATEALPGDDTLVEEEG